MTWNLKEPHTDNHYNCPVVAYYPEVIDANMKAVHNDDVLFIKDYVDLYERKDFAKKVHEQLSQYFKGLKLEEVKKATSEAFKEYDWYKKLVQRHGMNIIRDARKEGKTIIVLAGRPYHVDPLINHDINKLILQYNCAIVSEDVVARLEKDPDPARVLNQWTFHARMYKAANYVSKTDDMELIQLVSFGCGVDAVTGDEVRDIMERHDKIYTQVKIDEVTNLGTVKIRIRSLLEALRKKKAAKEANIKEGI
jgi:predicted nucleotide-binding protein (sugar kinase/HSP70/actin superfamily)